MTLRKYAIIDIGSNSVRYMEGLGDKRVYTTRLGSGLAASGTLSCESMAKSIDVIRTLAFEARSHGLEPVAYATSAVRDAANGAQFAAEVERECGVKVDVLSGEREAKYAFVGALGHDAGGGVIDIGGASMQIVTASFGRSYPVGCVRGGDIARATIGAADCDTNPLLQRQAIIDYMRGVVALPRIRIDRVTGVGGTITTLAALNIGLTEFDAEAVQSSFIQREDVERLIFSLIDMGAARKENPLLIKRHDVILYGAYILAEAMDMLFISRISVSCRDGMEGYLAYVSGSIVE